MEALWNVLTAAGGSLALTLIVTLALGITALTLLFVGSAVVKTIEAAGCANAAASVGDYVASLRQAMG